jgi:hypothetical protein
MLFVCWLAFRIRNIVDDFNESKTLAASAYVFLFCWAIIGMSPVSLFPSEIDPFMMSSMLF